MSNRIIEIDGSCGEAGGQVLRTALSVSCILGKPVKISSIRAGRSQPGLKAQHLAVCRLLAQITSAKMQGAALGSTEIIFEPGEISGGEFSFDIGTAGSCTLLAQAALPVLAHAEKACRLVLKGGTHVAHSPTFEYFSEVFLPAAAKFGMKCGAGMPRAGFYPKGGGEIVLQAEPSALKGALLAPERHEQANYSIVSSGLPPHVAKREEEKIRSALSGRKLEGKRVEAEASSAGNAITVWSGFFGASALGERGKPAEKVAEDACSSFLAESASGAAVDPHLADQLLVYAALAGGKSGFSAPKTTAHLETNAEVLRAMTGRNIMVGSEGRVEVI